MSGSMAACGLELDVGCPNEKELEHALNFTSTPLRSNRIKLLVELAERQHLA